MTEREFSRPITADSVPQAPQSHTITATPAECKALAKRLELEDISSLEATLTLSRLSDGQRIEVKGHIEADVVQTCVITLAPVPAHVTDDFCETFAPPSLIPSESEDDDDESALFFDPMADDLPEPFEDGRIDMGEIVAQNLSLALDPYPHAPDASLEKALEGKEFDVSPFSSLARMKTKQ